MAELRCKAENCVYYKDQLCCKGDIVVGGKRAMVSGETCCESFVERRGDSYTSAMDHPCKTINIDCEACNCAHNDNYHCCAENVEIKNPNACRCTETACGSFKNA